MFIIQGNICAFLETGCRGGVLHSPRLNLHNNPIQESGKLVLQIYFCKYITT